MKKKLNLIWKIIQIVVIIYVVVVTTFMFFSNEYGYTEIGSFVFDNTSNKDLLLIKKDNNINKNDNIYYYEIDDNKYSIKSNKVIKVVKDYKNSLYKLKNDTISSSKVIGKKVYKIKLLGNILRVLESKVGFLFLVLLPILIVFIYQVYEFVISIHSNEIKE